MISNIRWWNGLDFLWKLFVSKFVLDFLVFFKDFEVRKIVVLVFKFVERLVLLERIEYFLDWYYVKKVIVLCFVFM